MAVEIEAPLAYTREMNTTKTQHILFLCVANSARSQMAEGIARSLAPEGIQVSSAGSNPTSVHPLAIQALAEWNIDISNHQSKSVDTFDTKAIDTVITLCAREVCPAFLGKAEKLHWPLTDAATVKGDDGDQLDAFRTVRDDLRKRIRSLFIRSSSKSWITSRGK